MSRSLLPSVLFALWITTAPCIADKVTTDPNIAAAVATVGQDSDSRLAQKVAYQGGYKRLHAIAEELTKQTGVTVRAGLSRADWRVRDIPLIVCVKDMPLGTLLRSVASCAHATFAIDKGSTTVDGKPVYRLCRTKEQQNEITKNLGARAEANRKLALWAWDTLVAYSKMPDASSEIKAAKGEIARVSMTRTQSVFESTPVVDGTSTRKLAQALASLGPDARARFAAGDEINLWVRDNSVVGALYEYVVARQPAVVLADGKPAELLQPTDLERTEAYFAVKMLRQESRLDEGAFQCQMYGIPTGDDTSGRNTTYWSAAPVQSARALAAIDKLKLPKPPDTKAAFESDDSLPGPSFKRLTQDTDYSVEPLQAKISLDLPKTPAPWNTRAELLTALCKASGLNIVCEDFVSQKMPMYWYFPAVPVRSDTPGSVLRTIAVRNDTVWFFDRDSKLIVGWADNWRKHHNALVEESLLASIRAKRASFAGAELEDLVGLWELSGDQFSEWIGQTPDFAGIYCPGGAPTAMWRLYNRLRPEDKALARSSDGLPLANLDISWVMNMYNRTKKESEDQQLAGWCSEQEPHTKLRRQYFSDANLAGKLVLFVEAMPMDYWVSWTISQYGAEPRMFAAGPNGPSKHSYEIRLADTSVEDDKLNLRTDWGLPFPMFTPEREAELIKKAESNLVENTEPLKH